MKAKILAVFLLLSACAWSQNKKLKRWVAELHNSQFIIGHPEKASFRMKDYPAMKLIKSGKEAVPLLKEALKDSSKTIMAHLVLSHIHFGKVSFAGPKHQVSDDHELNKYFLGEEHGEGLIITEEEMPGGRYHMYVNAADRQKIIQYWKKRASP